MATLNSFFQLMMAFMLYCHFENVETASECKRRFTDPKEKTKSTFELFHMHGPCSPTAEMDMPSTQDILEGDRLRVEFLQTPFKPKIETKKYDSQIHDRKQLAEIPASAAGASFAITMGLGIPEQNVILYFDTSSNLTWTRCIDNTESDLSNMEFLPNNSASFSSVSCTSDLCTQLSNHNCVNFNNTDNTCSHDIDGLQAKGVLSLDTLRIPGTNDVFSNWVFVCATEIEENKDFNVAAGILGLGRKSVVRQTNQVYQISFSYCIPKNTNTMGFLKLGNIDYRDAYFTPFIIDSTRPPFYFINITSISVAGVKLSINTSELMNLGTIIDSRVTFTRLPMNVYHTMRDEFRDKMNNLDYKFHEDGFNEFDTCYDIGSSLTYVPNITFTFDGDLNLRLNYFASLYDVPGSTTLKCLAFVGTNNLAIFGNFQQRDMEMVYDNEGQRLGLVPGACQ